jgi:hypothetical protein
MYKEVIADLLTDDAPRTEVDDDEEALKRLGPGKARL